MNPPEWSPLMITFPFDPTASFDLPAAPCAVDSNSLNETSAVQVSMPYGQRAISFSSWCPNKGKALNGWHLAGQSC